MFHDPEPMAATGQWSLHASKCNRQHYHNIATLTGHGPGQHSAIFMIEPYECDAKYHHISGLGQFGIPGSQMMPL